MYSRARRWSIAWTTWWAAQAYGWSAAAAAPASTSSIGGVSRSSTGDRLGSGTSRRSETVNTVSPSGLGTLKTVSGDAHIAGIVGRPQSRVGQHRGENGG